jgi:hypothetical protein
MMMMMIASTSTKTMMNNAFTIFVIVGVVVAGPSGGKCCGNDIPTTSAVMAFVPQLYHLKRSDTTLSRSRSSDDIIKRLRGGCDTSGGGSELSLAQYADAVSSLFGNMITPASILGGAIIPIAFSSGLDYKGSKDETKFAQFLRKVFPLVSVASLLSMLISVLWSSITVNQ